MRSARTVVDQSRLLYIRDGVDLPPKELRAAGKNFLKDDDFLSFAKEDVSLVESFCASAGTNFLDFGSGVGRLYFGLDEACEPARYIGCDIQESSIRWASSNITVRNRRFKFKMMDVLHARYNPSGKLATADWIYSIGGGFNIIFAYSVLSHMAEEEMRQTIRLFEKIASARAFIFFTAFVSEQQVSPVEINPPGTGLLLSGPLHVVRYQMRHFLQLLKETKLSLLTCISGVATDGQTYFILQRRS